MTGVATIYPGLMAKDFLPEYQFLALLIGGGIACLSVVLVILKKRIGVFLYPITVFTQTVLLTKGDLLYTVSLVFLLFLFTGYGLVFIIPDWKEYK